MGRLYSEIDRYVENCVICKKGKPQGINTKNRVIIPKRPNEAWEIDLIGRMTIHDGKNKFILVAVDHYSKWVEACIINHKTGKEVAQAIKTLIIHKHGTPEGLLIDSGLEFLNSNMEELCKEYNIKHDQSSPNHHETVGLVERMIQTLFRKLKKLCEFGLHKWESKLAPAVYATNVSYNRVLLTSPYIFKNGVAPLLKIDK